MKTRHKTLLFVAIIFGVLYLLSSGVFDGGDNEYQKTRTETQQKKRDAYNALYKYKGGGFEIMQNTYLNHNEGVDNITVYIKHNSAQKKSFLFLKVTCQADAKRTKAITFASNAGYEKLDYVNEAYRLTNIKSNGKNYATLDIQIGEMLTEQLWKMSQTPSASVIFTDHKGDHTFHLTEAEKQGLEQVIMAYRYITGK